MLYQWGNDLVRFEVTKMEGFENFISMLDYVLNTKRKRRITGGVLLSISLLFGGLAITAMSANDNEEGGTYEQIN